MKGSGFAFCLPASIPGSAHIGEEKHLIAVSGRARFLQHRVSPPSRQIIGTLAASGAIWCAPALIALAQDSADRLEWPKTDFSKRSVDLAEIRSGGPPKDGIPAIDRPKFVPIQKAKGWLDPRLPPMERVLAITIGERTRLHPFGAFERTPIVESELAGTPYVVFASDRVASALDAESIAEGRKR